MAWDDAAFEARMNLKYQLMEEQQALAERERLDRLIGIKSAADYQNVQTKLAPDQAAAENALRLSQALMNSTQARWYGPEAQARINLQGMQGRGIESDIRTAEYQPFGKGGDLDWVINSTAPARGAPPAKAPTVNLGAPSRSAPAAPVFSAPPASAPPAPKKISYGGMMSSTSPAPFTRFKLGWLG